MSNTIVNVRFGSWHFQIVRDIPWMRFGPNPYHAKGSPARTAPGWRWFEIY